MRHQAYGRLIAVSVIGSMVMGVWCMTASTGIAFSEVSSAANAGNEAMAAWNAYATPGPFQAQLEKRSGSWIVDRTDWASAQGMPSTSTGTAEFKMTMGGRFLEQQYQTEGDGRQVVGWSLTGHNNTTNEVQCTWVDNCGTGMMQGTGHADGGTVVWSVKSTDPLKGAIQLRMVETIDGDDQFTVTMYSTAEDQSEYKVQEMTYRRQHESAVDAE